MKIVSLSKPVQQASQFLFLFYDHSCHISLSRSLPSSVSQEQGGIFPSLSEAELWEWLLVSAVKSPVVLKHFILICTPHYTFTLKITQTPIFMGGWGIFGGRLHVLHRSDVHYLKTMK